MTSATLERGYDLDSMPDHIGAEDPEPEQLDPASAKFVHDLVIRMLMFMDALVGHPLYPYQRRLAYRILESLIWQNSDGTVGDGETITALMARQAGKTETVADCVATAMILLPVLAKRFPARLGKYKEGLWVGCFAPVADQSETLFGRIVSRLTSERAQEILSESDLGDKASAGGKILTLSKSGSFIRMQTAHRRANIESKTYHLIVIDEAQNCDSFVVSKSIYPMGAATNASFIKTGTPTTQRGDFYDNIRLNLRLETKRGAKQNHYQANWREVCKYNKNYARYIDKEKRRIGEDSDEFQMAYNLKWLLERGMLTTQATLDELGDKSMKTYPDWTKTPVLIGIDPARRQDSTVVTAVWVNWDRSDADGYFEHRVINWLEMHGEQWEEQFGRIVEFCSHYNVLRVCVDKQGMGDLVEDRLTRLLPNVEVIGYDSTLPEQSRRWKHLITLIDKRLISWPAHAETRRTRNWKRFRQQMEEAEKHYKGPNILVEAPNETDAHDDYVDSLALAVYGSKDATMPTVEVSENVFYSGSRRY
jgi:hypothetical protein